MRVAVRVDPQDSISAIRERILCERERRIMLVVPSGCAALDSLVGYKLLRRLADDHRLDLRLSVADANRRILARQAGLRLTSPLMQALRLDPVRTGGAQPDVPWEVVGSDGVPRRPPPRKPRPARLLNVLAAIVVLMVVLFVAVSMLALFIPSATITLAPMAQQISGRMEIAAKLGTEEIGYGRASVPARWVDLQVSGSAQIPATGRHDVPDGRAEGEVVFANKTSEPVVVPKGTLVRTGSGVTVRFYTISDVELPAVQWGHARAGIIAMEPGPGGNVKSLTISVVEGPMEYQVDVINDVGTVGGSMKRVSIVAGDDHNRLMALLVQRLQQEAYNKLVDQLTEGEFTPPDTVQVEVIDHSFDASVGEESELVGLEMTVAVGGLAVDGASADVLLAHLLESRAPAGFRLLPGTLQSYNVGEVKVGSGAAVFSREATGLMASYVDEAHLKSGLRGKSLEEAETYLEDGLRLRTAPKIVVIPKWFDRLPLLPNRIKLDVQLEA